jgi:hypothetical protein
MSIMTETVETSVMAVMVGRVRRGQKYFSPGRLFRSVETQ